MVEPPISLRDYFEAILAERDKASAIKREGDLRALQLAREIQNYKDEKANELRAQIESERGHYVTQEQHMALTEKFENLLAPLQDFVVGQRGAGQASREMILAAGRRTNAMVAGLGVVVTIAIVVLNLLTGK